MDTSLFLAKVLGIFLAVMGAVISLRRKQLAPVFEKLLDDRPLVYIISIFAFIIGVLLVVSHNVWVAGWPVVVTILGWAIVLKTLFYLLLPDEVKARLFRRINIPAWYGIGGAVNFLVGVFLAGKGFQLF